MLIFGYFGLEIVLRSLIIVVLLADLGIKLLKE
jgi:hypothetical protein